MATRSRSSGENSRRLQIKTSGSGRSRIENPELRSIAAAREKRMAEVVKHSHEDHHIESLAQLGDFCPNLLGGEIGHQSSWAGASAAMVTLAAECLFQA